MNGLHDLPQQFFKTVVVFCLLSLFLFFFRFRFLPLFKAGTADSAHSQQCRFRKKISGFFDKQLCYGEFPLYFLFFSFFDLDNAAW